MTSRLSYDTIYNCISIVLVYAHGRDFLILHRKCVNCKSVFYGDAGTNLVGLNKG